MAFKFKEASSSDYPPDKKQTPTKAGTTVLDKAITVLVAISSWFIWLLLGLVDPGVTMLGFNKHPSKNILFYYKALKTADKTLSVTF